MPDLDSATVRYELSRHDLAYLLGRAAWMGRLRWQELDPLLREPEAGATDQFGGRLGLYQWLSDAVVNEVLLEYEVAKRLRRAARRSQRRDAADHA